MGSQYTYEVVMAATDEFCASVTASIRQEALAKAMYYARVYAQDGPVKVREAK